MWIFIHRVQTFIYKPKYVICIPTLIGHRYIIQGDPFNVRHSVFQKVSTFFEFLFLKYQNIISNSQIFFIASIILTLIFDGETTINFWFLNGNLCIKCIKLFFYEFLNKPLVTGKIGIAYQI